MKEHLWVQRIGSTLWVPINILFLGAYKGNAAGWLLGLKWRVYTQWPPSPPDCFHSDTFYMRALSVTSLLAISRDPYGQILLFRAPGIFWFFFFFNHIVFLIPLLSELRGTYFTVVTKAGGEKLSTFPCVTLWRRLQLEMWTKRNRDREAKKGKGHINLHSGGWNRTRVRVWELGAVLTFLPFSFLQPSTPLMTYIPLILRVRFWNSVSTHLIDALFKKMNGSYPVLFRMNLVDKSKTSTAEKWATDI